MLGPAEALVQALASDGVAPAELARRVAAALGALGWRVELVPGEDGDALDPAPDPHGDTVTVPLGAQAGALRIRPPAGAPADAPALAAVGRLAARVLLLARSGLDELAASNRLLRRRLHEKDALLASAAAELRAAAEILAGGTELAADERTGDARRLGQIAQDLERAARPAPEPRTPRPRRPAGPRTRVLVVDDEDDARAALAGLLEPDHEVITAADGEAAVERCTEEHPDLVLMDVVMPRLDGIGALERLRADPATADVPVIFVSGQSDDAVKVRSLDAGAVDFLQKPFSERELRARVERTLRLVRSQAQLRELAQTDPLTGLANLRAFRARLEEEVKRARRYRTPLTCVMADMDHLKPVNDELGHAAGDRAIAAVASVIRSELRETDFGARYGGDEFVLLLPHTTREEGRVLAERICARLRASPLEVSGRRVLVGASFGVAELPAGDDVGDALVRDADAALYVAKRAGRGRVAAAPTPGEPAPRADDERRGAAAG